MPRSTLIVSVALAMVTCCGSYVEAVILHSTSERNTTAPSGTLAGSGWQYQGQWGAFLGTPISPQHFVTAGHLGGAVGGTFSYNGTSYTTVASYDDPASDLRVWEVDGLFDDYAPLYGSTRESGKNFVVFGRGTQRGAEVMANGSRKGWYWGSSDGVQSWGQNVVSSAVDGGAGVGSLLRFTFDAKGVANEGTLSVGDSGGGLFIKDGGVWKLAAINYAVEGPFSLSGTTGSGFMGAIFDKGGLYTGGDGNWRLNRDSRQDLPMSAYSTRISTNLDWINSVLATTSVASTTLLEESTTVPEPAAGLFLVGAAGALLVRRRPPC